MASESFIPVSTREEDEFTVPMYSPDGPGGQQTPQSSSTFGIASGVDDSGTQRQNHLYFNFFCDCRRAVLAVNCLSIVINLVELIAVNRKINLMWHHPEAFEAGMDEDQKRQYERAVGSGKVQMMEALIDSFIVVSMLMHAFGMFGALKFNKTGIAVGGSAYVIGFVMACLTMNVKMIIYSVVMGYPHYFLIKEINSGIMTDYNYHNVAACWGTYR